MNLEVRLLKNVSKNVDVVLYKKLPFQEEQLNLLDHTEKYHFTMKKFKIFFDAKIT